jgi:long-chain fatty acid transport protein
MEMKRHHLLFLAVCSSVALAPSAASAQAFGLNELGSCAFARGFAATSAPCNDASTLFWNPGALVGMKGTSLLVGGAAIAIKAKFTRDSALGTHEGDVPLAIVPHIFLNRQLNDRMAVGIGMYVPYGLTSQWKDDFPGRFLAKKAALSTIYIQPNFAMSFKAGKWMFGGGPVFGISNVELIQSVDLSEQIARVDSVTVPTARTVIRFSQLGIAKRTEFARATLEGSTTSLGLNIGGLGKLNENWQMGFRYLSSLMMEYDGADASFAQQATGIQFANGNPFAYPAGTLFDTLPAVRQRFCDAATGNAPQGPAGGAQATGTVACTVKGLLSSQSVTTRIPHPDQFQFGFAYSGFKGWVLAMDYEWTGWRKLRELHVNFSNDSTVNLPATGTPATGGICPTAITAGDVCDYDVLDREILQDYNNTSALRFGAEKTFNNGWLVRLGFAGVASAAPDETVTPLLPEQDRSYWSIGSAFPIIKDKVTLDATYGLVLGSGRRGRIDERTARTVSASGLNSGIYDLSANVLSFSIKANF